MKVLNRVQVAELINHTPPEFKGMISVMFHLGLRISECVKLPRYRVDIGGKVVYIHGKNNKAAILPLIGIPLAVLRAEMKKNRGVYVWENSYTYHYGVRQIRQVIYDAANAAGLRNVHPHTLRHSRATTMLDAGRDIYRVKQLLRHSDVRTTQVYLDYSVEGLRKSMKGL